jgi:hypothetical protein
VCPKVSVTSRSSPPTGPLRTLGTLALCFLTEGRSMTMWTCSPMAVRSDPERGRRLHQASCPGIASSPQSETRRGNGEVFELRN